VIVGLVFYQLRSFNNKSHVYYGWIEIIASLVLMYKVYFPHGEFSFITAGGGGPSFLDTLTNQTVSFLVSVYAFVRRCDNIRGGKPFRGTSARGSEQT
jgi:hypothetical protein